MIPTPEAVAAWLTRYKERCAAMGDESTRAVAKFMNAEPAGPGGSDEPIPEDFFTSWAQFDQVRRTVAVANGDGYCNARDGKTQDCCPLKPEEGDAYFGWHNGWLVGRRDFDRRAGRA